ncbi:MAG: CinA family protein [Propionibacteriaceae bacterium]|nr:CinA family protein [Propionibacteriaceae bacterium]
MSAKTIIATLTRANQTLACAESLTGGMLLAALTAIPGASAVLRGGVVAYQTQMKHILAGVAQDVLAEFGPVSEQTASELALGVQRVCDSDWGVATTGVAGPTRQDGHDVGEVWIAITSPKGWVQGVAVKRFNFTGDRFEIRAQTVAAALDMFAETAGIK